MIFLFVVGLLIAVVLGIRQELAQRRRLAEMAQNLKEQSR